MCVDAKTLVGCAGRVDGENWAPCQFSSIKKLVPLSCLFPARVCMYMCKTCCWENGLRDSVYMSLVVMLCACVCVGAWLDASLPRFSDLIFFFSSSSFYFVCLCPFGRFFQFSTLVYTNISSSDWLSERVRDRACSTAERWKITHWPTFPSRPVAAVARCHRNRIDNTQQQQEELYKKILLLLVIRLLYFK